MLLPNNDRHWSKVFAACLLALLVFLTPQFSLAEDTGGVQLAQNVAGAEQTTSALPDVSGSNQNVDADEAGSDAAWETASDASTFGDASDVSAEEAAKAAVPVLSYSAHVQNKG